MRIFTKRLLAVLLSVIMVIMVVPVSSITVSAENTTEFLGGEGTEENPYLISNKAHLNNVRKYPDAHFKMVSDIVFTEADFAEGGEFYNDGQGWEPIGGNGSTTFTGVFDGEEHTITGLYCNHSGDERQYVGLFGYNKGTIRGLEIEDSDISASLYTGGIVGRNDGTIINCYNTGSVSASSPLSSHIYIYVGGIVGYNGGAISNCYNAGNVSAFSEYSYAGGIAGSNGGTISNCCNTGNVWASPSDGDNADVGGIVGDSYGTITNCYNTGNVLASSSYYTYAGGIAGRNYKTIINCYNTGNVSASSSDDNADVGGIAGYNDNHGIISNCYYLDNIFNGIGSGVDTTTKCIVEQMKQQSIFVGFDFDTVWEFVEGNPYPFPTLQAVPYFEENAEENTTEFAGGTGTPYNPYLISNKTHLNNVRKYLNAHFKMVADIVFTKADFAEGGEFYNNDQGWNSIGADDIQPFLGVFDGDGHNIIGLYCNCSGNATQYVGLFGYNCGAIRDLGIEDGDISASSSSNVYAGGITGDNWGTISNCYNIGNVSASSSDDNVYAGGIAGRNGGTISNCCNTGNILASSSYSNADAGGIAGRNYDIIRDCYNTGNLSASSSYSNADAGGIAGNNYFDGTITDCYNTGSMSTPSLSVDFAGGIAGRNDGMISNCYNTGSASESSCAGGIAGDNTGVISNCYNTGSELESSRAGGIAGDNEFNGMIINCYNTGNVSASSSSSDGYAGGIAGCNGTYDFEGTIINCYNTGNISALSSYYAYTGGIAGRNYKTITNCYYLDNILKGVGNGTDTATKCTAEQMKQQSTFVGFDFNSVWEIDSYRDYPYPQLKNNRQETPIQSIELLAQSADIQLIEGLWPDSIDATVKITYADGLEITTNVTSQMLSELDISQIGTQTIHLTYGGKVTAETIDIEVIPKSISSIAVTTLPDKTTYVQGQPLNPAGGELTVSYNNKTSEVVDLSEAQLSYPLEQTGTITATAEYNGFSATFSVTINEKQIQSIGIIEPEKVSYIEGETLDLTGGKLQITYVSEDNYTERIPLAVDMISGYDPNVIGIQTLTVEYEGQKITFVIRVTAKSLTHIAVTARPDKISYLEDKDAFDPTGGQVTLYYNNGTGEIIDLSAEMVSGFDNTQVGKQALTVTYEGFTDTFEVEITAKKLSAIKLTTLPTKLAYTKNYEAFDPTGGQVTLYYNNDTSEVIDLSVEMVSGFDNTQVGKQTLIVIYEGFNDTFEIEILAYLPGDTDGDSKVTIDDVAYLLNHVYFPELYPVSQECDFNGDDTVNIDDVAYLLNHVYFPDIYPLE